MRNRKDEQTSQSAVSATPREEIKLVTVSGSSKSIVQSLERSLSFIVSSGMFDEFQQFCIQHDLQKGAAV